MVDFTLAAYNAHWGVGRFAQCRGVRYDVVPLIRSFDADVVVVCESWRDDDGRSILEPLEADYHVEYLPYMRLKLRHDRSGHRDAAPRVGAWEMAVCSRFPVTSTREVSLGYIRHDPVRRRPALAVTLELGGHAVELIALHTSSFLLTLAPLRHLYALKRQLHYDGPQIIAGDFNFWGPPIALMMRGWERPVRGATYPGHRPHSQIDHILVRNGIVGLRGEVLPATPSDHRPVRARLRLLP